MSDNPYASPSSIPLFVKHDRNRELASAFSFLLTMVFPIAFLWGRAEMHGLVPQLPMENFWFEVAITMLIFLPTLAALPLAVVGLRSSHPRLAGVALFLGTVEASWIYFVKFHYWVMRAFSL